MDDIKKRLEDNYLLGYIKYKDVGAFYLMPIAYWILNYVKYNSQYDPRECPSVFRNNILNVTDDAILGFLSSIQEDKVLFGDFQIAVHYVAKEFASLYFYIDFDNKLFVNGFVDIEAEEYLPDESWNGQVDDPNNYLPDEFSRNYLTKS